MDEVIDCSRATQHIWAHHRILPEWVHEACNDIDRVILDPDPSSRSGRSLRMIGFSAGFGHPITVVAVRRSDRLEVTSAWRANPKDRRIYREGWGHEQQ